MWRIHPNINSNKCGQTSSLVTKVEIQASGDLNWCSFCRYIFVGYELCVRHGLFVEQAFFPYRVSCRRWNIFNYLVVLLLENLLHNKPPTETSTKLPSPPWYILEHSVLCSRIQCTVHTFHTDTELSATHNCNSGNNAAWINSVYCVYLEYCNITDLPEFNAKPIFVLLEDKSIETSSEGHFETNVSLIMRYKKKTQRRKEILENKE